MVAAFLQPSAAGSDEGAPRPLRALVPGLVVAGLLLAGFGAWGTIEPGAPRGWSEPGAKVLVGSESTTRYVILETDGRPELHPVLNLASARLLLDPGRFGVLKVDESVLDNGKIPHGPTLGIPYAPDRLPSAADAGTPKLWSACEQPGGDVNAAQKAAFVLAARDAPDVDNSGRLQGDQALYVEGPDGTYYLVDADGTAFPISGGADLGPLLRTLFGAGQPQRVTADWLRTLNQGRPLAFPRIPGSGGRAGVPGLDARLDTIGTVLSAPGATGTRQYVVLKGRIAQVSDLVAELLLNAGGGGTPAPQQVAARDLPPVTTTYLGGDGWPKEAPRQVNTAPTTTVCGVYRGTMRGDRPDLSVWAGTGYPAPVVDGGGTAYVSPGSGLLYREVGGTGSAGAVYLVTDTGLRYSLPPSAAAPGRGTDEARIRLGYGQVRPVPVPAAWSAFLPVGPALDTGAAGQPQGS